MQGQDLIQFTYPEIHKGKDFYIWYKAADPATGKLKRVRHRLNHLKGNKERQAQRLVNSISRKLESGWNPFIESDNENSYRPIAEALEYVLQVKSRNRAATNDTYKGRVRLFVNWLRTIGKDGMISIEFTQSLAYQFLDYIYIERGTTARTHNNYLTDFRNFFKVMKKRGFVRENFFEQIEPIREDVKQRQPFTEEEQAKIADHLFRNDLDFFFITCYTYYCALRNSEIGRLKIENIDLEKKVIHVPAHAAKNHHFRVIPIISDFFVSLLRDYLPRFPKHYYLCSEKCKPGDQLIENAGKRITYKFSSIAKELNLPKGKTFYSYKDTLASHLIMNNANIKEIQQLLGHHQLTSTEAYLRRHFPSAETNLRNKIPELIPPKGMVHDQIKKQLPLQ